ncbi:predicted protein [Thalassiosira pseudonana CCMP1335]|uniref:Transmembrane protein n=1 Tax=Thalassiosira pseudonana TaxID=35128 RepID=B8BQZ7_THAPS|nr:predicted protein [Thalassiosira pseudonana CCMP1335]EED96448.1 predicted protein [Thalassiosira pseudonana CCMP1335]|eukprot:g1018.t1 g1018   contig10:1189480-1189914(-)
MNGYLFLLSCLSMAASASCFLAPSSIQQQRKVSLGMMMDQPAPPSTINTESVVFHQSSTANPYYFPPSPIINNGISQFLTTDKDTSSAIMTSTNILSLKERPPPPTAEEIAAKKRTFNLWFWGGGFVAPFLATFYYFGFKFWER